MQALSHKLLYWWSEKEEKNFPCACVYRSYKKNKGNGNWLKNSEIFNIFFLGNEID